MLSAVYILAGTAMVAVGFRIRWNRRDEPNVADRRGWTTLDYQHRYLPHNLIVAGSVALIAGLIELWSHW